MAVINHQTVGDKGIDTQNFNRMADGSAKSLRLFFDPKYFVTQRSANADTVSLKEIGEDNVPFPLEIFKVNGETLGVRCGGEQRNTELVKAPYNNDGAGNEYEDYINFWWEEDVSGYGDDWYYVVLKLMPDAPGAGDEPAPWLLPATNAEYVFPTSLANYSAANDPFNRFRVLGRFRIIDGKIAGFRQWDFRGNIDTVVNAPDTDNATEWTATNKRYTIELNPEAFEQKYALQLRHVDDVVTNSKSIPYFTSTTGTDVIEGDLWWAAPDRHATAAPANYSLEFLTPDTATGIMQVYDFDSPGAYITMAEADRVMIRVSDTPNYVAYVTADALGDWLNDYGPVPDLSWIELNDTDPVNYTGKAGYISTVNAGPNGLDLLSPDAVAATFRHSLLDPAGAFDPAAYVANEDHDYRYWFSTGAGSSTGFGTDDPSYYTTGDCRADEFALVDDAANNYWTLEGLRIDTTGQVYIESQQSASDAIRLYASDAAGGIDIDAGGTIIATAGSHAGWVSTGGQCYMLASGAVQPIIITSVTGIVDIDAGTDITIDAGADIEMIAGAGHVQIGAGTDIDLQAADDLRLTTIGGEVIVSSAVFISLDAATYLNLNPTGELQINGNVGATLTDGGNNLFEKGVCVNDGSWGFLTIQTIVPGSGLRQLRILTLDVT